MTTVDVSATAGLAATLGRLADRLDKDAARQLKFEYEMSRAVQSVIFPAVQFTITSNQVTPNQTQATQLGPEDGQVWDVRRVSIFGLGTNDQLGVYRQLQGITGGAQQNFLDIVTATAPVWNPSGGLLLKSPDQLALAAYSATLTATAVTLSWEGIAIDARLLWKYLL